MRNRLFVPDFLFDFYTNRGSIDTPSALSNVSRAGLSRKIQPSRRQFSRVTLFFQPIHWPYRELLIRENGILKLHTILEIFASNPILKTHFSS